MKVGLSNRVSVSNKLSSTLKSWLPLLQVRINDLEDMLSKATEDNPFVDIKTGFENKNEKLQKSIYEPYYQKHSSQETIEKLTVEKQNFYDKLYEQIEQNLFPTPISKEIAKSIVIDLNNEGYFDGNIDEMAKTLNVEASMIERVRKRFAYIDPPGIGAIDYKESFLFQLEHLDLEDGLYNLCSTIIENLEDIYKYKKHKGYKDALAIIKKFRNPPRIDYNYEDISIVADILIYINMNDEGREDISIELNNSYYPTLHIDIGQASKDENFVKNKIKEANDIINAISMRKSTLLKVGRIIMEHQYDFFLGSAMKPMKLKDIANELGYNQSTISRAISDKYIACDRGLFAIKTFFTTSLDEETDVSNSAIKDYISELVKNENNSKPYSDEKLREHIKEKFNINIVRRTVTKYRKQLNIGSSTERKKYLYL
jgi:RNA polymerase sigma-54 factor